MPQKISKTREGIKHAIMWFVLFFAFFPLYLMVVISFKDNSQFNRNPWFSIPFVPGTGKTGPGAGRQCRITLPIQL